jgi:hypothetical protein
MTDKTPDKAEKTIEENPPTSDPTTPTTIKRSSTSRKTRQTPLERAIRAFVDGIDPHEAADRLLAEFERVGIESLEDVGPHRLGDVRHVLQVAYRATAHDFYAAAAEFRSDQ